MSDSTLSDIELLDDDFFDDKFLDDYFSNTHQVSASVCFFLIKKKAFHWRS